MQTALAAHRAFPSTLGHPGAGAIHFVNTLWMVEAPPAPLTGKT
jgi:hypothetical protein